MRTFRQDGEDGGRVVDLPASRRRRFRLRFVVAALALLLLAAGSALISWYVDALWFGSLGYASVFWGTVKIKAAIFVVFAAATIALLQGAFWALRPRRLTDRALSRTLVINGQPVTLSLGRAVRLAGRGVALIVGVGSGLSMMAEWTTFALFWHAPPPLLPAAAAASLDPIFGRTINFYLFTLPVLELLATWLTTLAVIVLATAIAYFLLVTGERALGSLRGLTAGDGTYGGVSFALAGLLLILAWRVYLSRFDLLFQDRTIFSGVNYTDAHIVIPGLLLVALALVLGGVIAAVNGAGPRRFWWVLAAAAPAVATYVVVTVLSWYVSGFIVKPNELVRETPFIAHNIDFTRRAFSLTRVEQRAFPAEVSIEAVNQAHNQATLQNIRLWDWRALQDTLRQIQEIRTYYDFPDIDIDRYRLGGQTRQMMVAARELSIQKLPASSRNWINEKLIYTHGYGVTMNPVNGFTPEGLPQLVLSDMPVRSTTPEFHLTRPEIYFGQLTNTDVYVRTRQKEFNYPQGESNNYTTYEGTGGIAIGSFSRRLLIAIDRGDLAKLPFADDVTAGSRLLMRRNIRERVNAIAPFLTYDFDPYIVVASDGRLYWLMDAYTSSETFPYARHYQLGNSELSYLRNSVKVAIDAYNGSVTFYVFDTADPIIEAYRRTFPSLFRDAADMPESLRVHVRYPELLLKVQAAVYSLYHMADPQVFYNREDLWSVASQVTLSESREQVTQPLEPNFVLMQLEGESAVEFVEILPFTPSNRNNLIGWIAGRSDGAAYGHVLVYDFPKTRLVDGPLQIEARIDQNAQISSQLTLWNQQGSHVRRGNLLVIPIGRALVYAEPIYLQAERSPMPQLRLVVLAVQDRLGYGPDFETAMANLFGATTASEPAGPDSTVTPTPAVTTPAAATAPAAGPSAAAPSVQALIDQAARHLADYQRLTAEGKLGEAGQKLEALKRTLEELKKEKR